MPVSGPHRLEPEPRLEPAPPTRARESVAAVLRRERMAHGQTVRAIAQVLRIRQGYIEALESGEFDRLPGTTYALGFLRTYAEYLGLDGTEMVDRFKAEVEGAEQRTELVFPEPVVEGRIPGGAIILISFALMAVAYGGWYYVTNEGRAVSDLIPAMPSQLRALVEPSTDTPSEGGLPEIALNEGTPSQAAGEPARTSGIEPGSVSEAAPDSEVRPDSALASVPAPDSTPGFTAEPSPAPMHGEATGNPPVSEDRDTPESPLAATRAPEPESGLAEDAAPEPEAGTRLAALPASPIESAAVPMSERSSASVEPAPEPAQNLPVEVMPETPVQTPAIAASPPYGTQTVVIPAPPRAFEAPPVQAPRIYGNDGDTRGRIVVRAKQDSWVQVRDAQDALLLTRVLRAGDVYYVPNLRGLTLLTGNAGGIEIAVDGVTLPPLGPVGAVRRQIALDPDQLLSSASAAQ